MGYRQLDCKPKPKRREFRETSTRNKIFIQNGTRTSFAIPCWYSEVLSPERLCIHDIDMHDHCGWPEPDRPDHSCQSAYHPHLHHHHHLHHMHDPYNHEHHGWDHHKHLLDMSQFIPIHLTEEGYTSIETALDNSPSGLSCSASIDKYEDWVVRFDIAANCRDVVDECLDVRYALFASGKFEDRLVKHMITKGMICVVPGPIA